MENSFLLEIQKCISAFAQQVDKYMRSLQFSYLHINAIILYRHFNHSRKEIILIVWNLSEL